MEPPRRLELPTNCLQSGCSTIELRGRWSVRPELNRCIQLGRLAHCHCTKDASTDHTRSAGGGEVVMAGLDTCSVRSIPFYPAALRPYLRCARPSTPHHHNHSACARGGCQLPRSSSILLLYLTTNYWHLRENLSSALAEFVKAGFYQKHFMLRALIVFFD